MNENPLVSEIIVTQDRCGLLSKTIESILRDRFEDANSWKFGSPNSPLRELCRENDR
jgi:hypothetical protein